jgi:site-specific recombinase XerD
MPRHGKPIYEVKVRGQVRWKVYVSLTRGGQRKRISKTFDSYEEAERYYSQSQLGDVVARTRDTFDSWAEQWLARKQDEGCREITTDGYSTDLKRPREAFGRYRIQEVTEQQVEDVVRKMRDEGLSRRSSAKMLTTLRAVFDFALRKGVVRFNPAKDVTPMGRPSKERDALTASELEKLRKAITGEPLEACWMLTLAGLRRSELLGLRWSDFDPSTGELTVRRGRVALGGEGETKTARGRRVLPLDQERVDLLVAYAAWQLATYGAEQATDGLILVNELGRPMRPEDWTRRWRKLCLATEGVRDDHTLHAARHSTVTFMRNAGVPDHIVAAWHGHDEVIMRRTYSHVHNTQMRTAGSALAFGSTAE